MFLIFYSRFAGLKLFEYGGHLSHVVAKVVKCIHHDLKERKLSISLKSYEPSNATFVQNQ